MELSRDFVPPVFVGVLPLFGALRTLGISTMATDPLTVFSSSSALPFGLLLLLFREGENESARLAILRPRSQVAMDSCDIFSRTHEPRDGPQLSTIQRISNQAFPRIQSAPILLYVFQETIPWGSSFPKRGSGCHPATAASVTSSNFSWKLIWSLKTLFRSVGAETKASSTATHRALRCHTREAVEFCFLGAPVFFFFRYPYLVGHDLMTEPDRVLLQLSFPSLLQKNCLEFDLHRFCMDPKTSCQASPNDARTVIFSFIRPALHDIQNSPGVGEAWLGPERTTVSQDRFISSRKQP